MSAVLVGKIYAFLVRAPSCPEMPLCNWYVFAGYGFVIGAISLPVLVIWRLRRADERSDQAAGDTLNRG